MTFDYFPHLPNGITSMGILREMVVDGFKDWQFYGDVKATYHDGLVLFNYTNAVQFAGRWNWFESISRGLILDTLTGEIVARPFAKFFNYGERVPAAGAKLVEVTEKMDGSLGILYRYRGTLRIATRGSFDSEQALWANDYLREYGIRPWNIPNNMTLLFEIVYPENRIVVDYKGTSALYLIGGIDRFNGNDLRRAELAFFSHQFKFPMPMNYPLQGESEILSLATKIDANREGWVLRYDDGSRYKVKGDAYKLAHKMLTGVSYSRVLEAVTSGSYDQMIEGIPDEFLAVVKEYKHEIDEAYYEIAQRVRDVFIDLPPFNNRKDAAIWLKENHPEDMHYVFAMMDNKPIDPLIYKAVSQRERVQQESENGLA